MESELSDKIKQEFFQVEAMLVILYGCITRTLTKCFEKKLDWNYSRILHAVLNKLGNNSIQNNSSHQTNHPNKMNKSCCAGREKQRQTQK